MTDPDGPLPGVLRCSTSFTKRLPNQRLLDQLAHLEPAMPFGELAQAQPFRIIAFRILTRDYPARDVTSLWLHAYDCEVEVEDEDPLDIRSLDLSPPSVTTGTFGQTS